MSKTSCPYHIYEGGGIAYGTFPLSPLRDSIYVICGDADDYDNRFCHYDISANGWTRLANVPLEMISTYGGAICFVPAPNGYHRIYALINDVEFYKFSHTGSTGGFEGTWANTYDDFAHYAGCALCFGGNTYIGGIRKSLIYAFVGGSSNDFYCFAQDVSPDKREGALTTHWSQKADFPADSVGHGALTFNEKYSPSGSKVYGLGGGGDCEFAGYNPSANSWASGLADPWPSIGPGVGLAAQCVAYSASDTSDTIYAMRGNWTPDFKMYTIHDDDWDTKDDLPWDVGPGGGLAFCPYDRYFYALRGDNTGDFAQFQPYADDEEGGQGERSEPVAAARVTCRILDRSHISLECLAAVDRNTQYSIHDVTGRRVWQTRSSAGRVVWQLEPGTPAGSYIAVLSAEGLRAQGRVTVGR